MLVDVSYAFTNIEPAEIAISAMNVIARKRIRYVRFLVVDIDSPRVLPVPHTRNELVVLGTVHGLGREFPNVVWKGLSKSAD